MCDRRLEKLGVNLLMDGLLKFLGLDGPSSHASIWRVLLGTIFGIILVAAIAFIKPEILLVAGIVTVLLMPILRRIDALEQRVQSLADGGRNDEDNTAADT